MLRVQVPGLFGREEQNDEQHSRTGLLLRHPAQSLSGRLYSNRTLARSGESNIEIVVLKVSNILVFMKSNQSENKRTAEGEAEYAR
jgi:hypothetical protein